MNYEKKCEEEEGEEGQEEEVASERELLMNNEREGDGPKIISNEL